MSRPDARDGVIVAIGRSPIGRARKGILADIRPDDLAAQVAAGVIGSLPQLNARDLEDLYLGCAEPSGEQGFNLARQVALLMGHDALPGATVNRFCASSLQAARMAFHAIRAGEGDAFMVCGVESGSRVGMGAINRNDSFAEAALRTERRVAESAPWSDPRSVGEFPDAYISMGRTAEFVASVTGTTRLAQDEFAARSQRLAAAARDEGFSAREIVGVTGPDGRLYDRDDSIRPETTTDALADLPPAFSAAGSVTAGNACPLSDGAAACVIVSAAFAEERGIEPLARIVSTAVGALSPEIMGLGPVDASKRALMRAGMRIEDVDIVEMNEAFAAQVIPSAERLGIDIDSQLNPFGGAIALGHPFGATGVRLIATLLNGLATRDQTVGLATLCVGGGQGMAIVVERL